MDDFAVLFKCTTVFGPQTKWRLPAVSDGGAWLSISVVGSIVVLIVVSMFSAFKSDFY